MNQVLNQLNLRKKTAICLFALLVILTGCATTFRGNTIIFDRNLPESETCILEVGPEYKITSFDGEKVKWKNRNVVLPSGNHIITFDYSKTVNEFKFFSDNVTIEIECHPHTNYEISMDIVGFGAEGFQTVFFLKPLSNTTE